MWPICTFKVSKGAAWRCHVGHVGGTYCTGDPRQILAGIGIVVAS